MVVELPRASLRDEPKHDDSVLRLSRVAGAAGCSFLRVVGYPRDCWILVLGFLRRPTRLRGNSGRFDVEALLLPLIGSAVDTVAFRSGHFATAEYAIETTTRLPVSLAFCLWDGVDSVALDFLLVQML